MEKAHDLSGGGRTLDVSIEEDIKFSDMLLSERTLKGLEAAGFKKPSPIQRKAIPLGRCGFDLIVQAKSGTGKTCVFTVIAMEMLNLDVEKIQVMILTPTREISVQISNVISTIAGSKPKIAYFIGGMPIEKDKKKLKNCQIAIGAPGRIKHLISEGLMNLDTVRLFILDEADRLMEDSFRRDISFIYTKLPLNKQMIAASATFPESLEEFVSQYMKKPMKVSPGADVILLGVRQFVSLIPAHPAVLVQIKNKTEELIRILSNISFKQCLVFSNYHSRAEGIRDELIKKGWPTALIGGYQTQSERLEAYTMLKEYRCRVLISTDLTSRGIDAENVNLIVNLDMPYDGATYLHRIGRAGRYGSYGIAITIVQDGEEVDQFRKLLYQVGGEKFRVSIYPKQKLEFNIWDRNVDNFEKLESLFGTYKHSSVKDDSEVRTNTKKLDELEISSEFSILREMRLPAPEKVNIDSLESYGEKLKNFVAEESDLGLANGNGKDLVFPKISKKIQSSLVQLEKLGWKSFYREFAGFSISNESPEECNQENEAGNLKWHCEEESSYSEESSSSSEEESEELDSYESVSIPYTIQNWYSQWFNQVAIINNYVQYYHYWNDMINFR